jgi:hypothetical protein
MEDAACAQRTDLDWFDYDCNLQECLRICSRCTVQDDCLEYATTHELHDGIWGGLWGYRLLNQVGAGRAHHG